MRTQRKYIQPAVLKAAGLRRVIEGLQKIYPELPDEEDDPLPALPAADDRSAQSAQ